MTAYKLIKEHKNIENVIKHLENENNSGSNKKKKFNIPKEFNYIGAREMFLNPLVEDPDKIDVIYILFKNNLN